MNKDRFKFRVWENNTRNCYLKDEKTAIVGDGDLIYGDMITNAMPLAYGADNPNIIVEQSTGLRDKNGNLIYEGDIVKSRLFNPWHNETPNPKIKGVVCFIQDRMTWIVEDGEDGYDFEDCMEEYFEIIGNIHEQKDNK